MKQEETSFSVILTYNFFSYSERHRDLEIKAAVQCRFTSQKKRAAPVGLQGMGRERTQPPGLCGISGDILGSPLEGRWKRRAIPAASRSVESF